jgi:hypothetical protein
MCSLLTTYNLLHTVHFATRKQHKSSTAIDNIFVDNRRLESSYTSPLINGLSDHDAQFLKFASTNEIPKKQRRPINSNILTIFRHYKNKKCGNLFIKNQMLTVC